MNMPTYVETKCCMEEPLDNTNIPDYQEGECLLGSRVIQHILDKISVQISWLHQRRYHGFKDYALAFTNMSNKNYRHHAYRLYIDYIYGLLGRHNRKVVPACIVAQIRERWPSENDEYCGFIQVNEEGEEVPMDELLDNFCKLFFYNTI